LALSPNTYLKYKQFIELFEEYVFSLKLIDGINVVNSSRKTGFVGIEWVLKNWLNVYDLIQEKNYCVEYILSYKISQDHLETFFSTVKSKGGYNNNPSAKEFKASYK
jgi:DNA transposase THAP9